MSRRPIHIENLKSYQEIAEEMALDKDQGERDVVEKWTYYPEANVQWKSLRTPLIGGLLSCIYIVIVADVYVFLMFFSIYENRWENFIVGFWIGLLIYFVYSAIRRGVMDRLSHWCVKDDHFCLARLAEKQRQEIYVLTIIVFVLVAVFIFPIVLLFF